MNRAIYSSKNVAGKGKTAMIQAMTVILVPLFMASCDSPLSRSTDAQSGSDVSQQTAAVIAQYKQIGDEHNALLKDYHTFLSQERADSINPISEDALFVERFGITDEARIIHLSQSTSTGRSVNEPETLVETMLEGAMVNVDAAVYMGQIENLLQNPLEDFAEMQNAITNIESQAIEVLDASALTEFMAYAETAKASLFFWAENYESLTNSGDLSGVDSSASNGLFDFIVKAWNKYKHKLAMMAASDAAGAAIGSTIPGVGSATGAIAGAIACGVISSERGFNKDALCIVIDIGAINKEINKRK